MEEVVTRISGHSPIASCSEVDSVSFLNVDLPDDQVEEYEAILRDMA